MVPDALFSAVTDALAAAGDASPITNVTPVYGGDINRAARLDTGSNRCFLKWNDQAPPGLFLAEARGLELIGSVGEVRVPNVIAAREASAHAPAFLALEWLDVGLGAYSRMGKGFGERLATFHLNSGKLNHPGYGLDHDNYIALAPQSNAWDSDWIAFFRERRLRDQIKLASELGLLTGATGARLDRLTDRVDEWLGGVDRRPSLLHGDLWSGNVLFAANGDVVLIDPAVYWGDREFDLATVEIYGAAPSGFFEAYNAVWPIEPGRLERQDLYHLCLWLSCLICGQNYLARIDRVARRYVG